MDNLGLIEKFEIKRNKRPYPAFGGNHFVLTPKSDPHARAALETYAHSIEKENPTVAAEITGWLEAIRVAEYTAANIAEASGRQAYRDASRL